MNNEDVKQNIFYKPDISIDRHYDTDGAVVHPSDSGSTQPVSENTTEIEDIYNRAQQVEEDLLKIRSVITLLPEKTAAIIQDIVDKELLDNVTKKDELQKIINKDKEDKENKVLVDSYPSGTKAEGTDDEDESGDEEWVWEEPDPIDITINVVRRKDDAELANEQYLMDSVKIKEEFAYKLNNAMQDYIYPLMTVMGEVGLDSVSYLNLDYEGESITGVDTDDKHLHDTIVRNQTIVDEKNRKFAKTHGVNMSLAIMTAFDVVAQERVRYYKEEYDIGLSNFTDMYKRNILEETRKEYDNKYMKSKINMYRFLNSAVTVADDILKATLRSHVAKCYLLTQDVNIYARKNYESTQYNNPSDNSMIELTQQDVNTSGGGTFTSSTANKTTTTKTTDTSKKDNSKLDVSATINAKIDKVTKIKK